MKRYFRTNILCLLIALLISVTSYATHILGGELLYTALSANQYKISLTIYGDCSGLNFPKLDGGAGKVDIYYDGNIFLRSVTLIQEGPGVEVSQVCPSEWNNTKCKNIANVLPGVTKYVYTAFTSINITSSVIRFSFSGDLTTSLAGRSQAITNIQGGGSSQMYLEAILNNQNGPNSSPQYTSVPTPYFCINKQQRYNQGATDPDNDSLVFSLAPGLAQGQPVTYNPPYNSQEPLSTVAGTFKFNTLNGQMEFIPDQSQTSLVVNKVEEYKNGKLVGSSMREMNFIVLSNCNNNPPNSALNNDISGAKNLGDNMIYACRNNSDIYFSISAYDQDSNNVSVSVTNPLPGASVAILDNNTAHPRLLFNWNISSLPDGIYNFFVNYLDDACPISAKQTIAYTIVIVPPYTARHEVLYPTNCYNKQLTRLIIDGGTAPKEVTLLRENAKIRSFTDSSNKQTVFDDSLAAGKYTLEVSSPLISCSLKYDFTVADSGRYPIKPDYDNMHLCVGDAFREVPVTSKTNMPVIWYDEKGNRLSAPPAYNTSVPNIYTFYVTQQMGLCESIADTFRITIHKLPEVDITTMPKEVCLGDKVMLEATGADYYSWQPADKVTKGDDGKFYTKITSPITLTVTGTTLYGCMDSTDITYNDIQQCCTFSYPNAFTPNGDGRNDGFRVILYGNESDYQLSIFNRWGEEVFKTNDPKKYWDGNYKNQPCEVGVYYYYMKGACLTGHKEEKAGEFTLIR